ncbi:uncharacterized protein LOC131240226 [Magnolia sinica]|uniref:uncharacterized protein LOC131218472 n=1 Tax=Magnolia sinica TaxID=86752 RepID=UPI00265A9C02|nr:uncharacterized protein LOC131218472 [Magnolia sinica]XP_058094338.1 uncharacterized protein LOC131240226 [Magnolia sinica]
MKNRARAVPLLQKSPDVYKAACNLLKDPTEQTGIDNFMVQQLDGTVNEWGWCKQKVSWLFLIYFYFIGVYDPSCWGIHFQGSHEDGCRSISPFEGKLLFCLTTSKIVHLGLSYKL